MNRGQKMRKFIAFFTPHSRSTAKLRHPSPPPIEMPPVVQTLAVQAPEERDRSGFSGGQSSGWVSSILLHILLLFAAAMFVKVAPTADRMVLLLSQTVNEPMVNEELQEFVVFEPPEFEVVPVEDVEDVEELEDLFQTVEMAQPEVPDQAERSSALVDAMDSLAFASNPVALVRLPAATIGAEHPGGQDAGATAGDAGAGNGVHGELGGRVSRRIQFATPGMNYSINRGLMWLARHQLADGGWSFEHRVGQCQGRCPNPGSKRGARVAATGLALLPFLGAGHSPSHGEYRQTVSAGINFLISNTSTNGSLWRSEGRMYGHGIATLALCECYGILTQTPPIDAANTNSMEPKTAYGERTDAPNALVKRWTAVDVERLKQAATAAVGFIVKAQAVDGGWRYRSGELGDTSVVGWQVMALKSAKDAGLGIHEQSVAGAQRFLNSVQFDPVGNRSFGFIGTRYAYKPDRRKVTPATTAIGLACRICMGKSPFHPAVVTAVDRIVTEGHGGGDMYYNFYANQVVFQHGGAAWESWNQQLSKALIKSQNRRGHLEGSWHFDDADHGGTAGGRVYTTAMVCLCLEESFRHLPTFRINAQRQFIERLRATAPMLPGNEQAEAARKQADADEFPL